MPAEDIQPPTTQREQTWNQSGRYEQRI